MANDANSSNYCPYDDVVDEVRDIENAADVLDVLNKCVVPEEDDTRPSLPKMLQTLYDEWVESNENVLDAIDDEPEDIEP